MSALTNAESDHEPDHRRHRARRHGLELRRRLPLCRTVRQCARGQRVGIEQDDHGLEWHSELVDPALPLEDADARLLSGIFA